MTTTLYAFDNDYRKAGYKTIVGIDEAGRGPLAGPVVAAAVALNPAFEIDGIDDSKRLTAAKRKHLFYEILYNALSIGIGIVDAHEIDRINILNATKLAMSEAVSDLSPDILSPDILLIDALKLPAVTCEQVSIIKGDTKSASIAAASIIAKVLRDSIMFIFHEKYPLYNFISHKGYGTREHVENINTHGPCEIHRKTFAPVSVLKLQFQ
ncbi:ribonuclease HII [Candidatus Magnetominusculus xianensis]|uniref:Ribonuclease HII n=1 Tax=Candidatus Magnetominusculus xianensis TaxID=1748249 RepID=A0ABR5SIM8_9BACT|nr:ribonuclease HII [Candidatus Magnetominusculus xianensis]KWT92761.1 ribonuclease HII [Candidatus Magnetominusculus xianensis]MBF0405215.1 ribonuclease HII [Nitrospirota bacterium]